MTALVRGVTVYMIVIEGTLALTGARFIIRILKDLDLMPGFRQGFTAVNRDESRHVGFGVKFLADAIRQDPAHARTVQDTLQETLPIGTLALAPPMADDPYDFETPFGYGSGEIYEYAMRSLSKKLAAMGMGAGPLVKQRPEAARRAGRPSSGARERVLGGGPRRAQGGGLRGPHHREGGCALRPEQGADRLPLRLQAGARGGRGPRGAPSRSRRRCLAGSGASTPSRTWCAGCSTACGG